MRNRGMRALNKFGKLPPWAVLLCGLFGLASFCLCFWFVGIPLFCSYQLRFSPPDVDFAPLQELQWPSGSDNVAGIFNLEVLDELEQVAGSHWVKGSLYIQKDESHYADLSVKIYLAPPLADAEAHSQSECRKQWAGADTSKFVFGTEGESEYCISYVRPLRADAWGLCLPVGYESFVVLRKHNLVVTIAERTSDKRGSAVDFVMRQLIQTSVR